MRKLIAVLTIVSVMLSVGIITEAKTTNKGNAKAKTKRSTTATVNYTFQTTADGFKSPEGYTYTARLETPRKDEIVCTKAVMTFINSEIMKVTYYNSAGWTEEVKYYAWHQDKDYIFISDDNDPLKISENGKTLTSVYTGSVYNIGKSGYHRPEYTPDVSNDMIFVDVFYGRPWILSPDGTATREFDKEVWETGKYTKNDGGFYKLEFNSKLNDIYPHQHSRYLIVGDTIYNVHTAYEYSDPTLTTPRVDDYTYDPSTKSVIITKVNGSTDVSNYMRKLYNPEIYGPLKSSTIPLSKLNVIGYSWKPKNKEQNGVNQVVGSFTYKGQKFTLMKNGAVILKDRSRGGIYEEYDGGKSYQVHTGSLFYEGGDSFLIVGDNVYAIDIGCCDCVYSFTYDWKNKIVIEEGGCDDEISIERTPLSKMKPVAVITWTK